MNTQTRTFAVLVGATVQLCLVLLWTAFGGFSNRIAFVGLIGGGVTGLLVTGRLYDAPYYGGAAAGVSMTVYFLVLVAYNVFMTWETKGVFAPLIISALEFVYAILLIPIATLTGGVGGFVGQRLRQVTENLRGQTV